MKKLILLFVVSFLFSCDKEDDYVVSINDLHGVWMLDKYDSYTINVDDESLKDRAKKIIEGYSCDVDRYEFIVDETRYRPFWMERNNCRNGIIGCDFTINGDKLIDAANQIEAFDLRIVNDTLFLSLDETMSFNRDLETKLFKNLTLRNKYIRLK